jgi:hypothetical protein
MSFNKDQLLQKIIRPTLNFLKLGGEAAENLLLGTCAQESKMGTYLAQVKGPALGIYQIEPTTFNDIYDNYLIYHQDILTKINTFSKRNLEELVSNLKYATALARIKYLRAPYALPDANDIEGLAQYWKNFYNTPKGKGTIDEFISNYKKYVL